MKNRWLVGTVTAIEVILLVAGAGAALVAGPGPSPEAASWGSRASTGLIPLSLVAYPLVGGLIAARRRGNPIGGLLLASGACWAVTFGLEGLASGGFVRPGSTGASAAFWVSTLAWWVPAVGFTATFLLQLFPDGRLPGRRWRRLAHLSWATLLLVFVLVTIDPNVGGDGASVRNPYAIGAARPVLQVLSPLFVLFPACIIGSVASVVVRYRRAGADQRQQIKWLGFAGASVAVIYGVTIIATFATEGPDGVPVAVAVLQDLTLLSYAAIPAAVGVAVLRYRLYDIDVVISKTLVYATLSVLIAAVYIAVVAGVGGVLGRGSDELLLPVLATGLIAVGFGPVRERVQRIANRLVFGDAASPYEVVSAFGERIAAAPSDDVLQETAETIRRALRLRRAELRVGGRGYAAGEPATTAPDHIETTAEGELAAWGQLVRRSDYELLADLAAQASLAARSIRLRTELARRNEELAELASRLAESRARVGRVADEQRRRIERTIHDGPQQRLVALQVSLRLAEELLQDDPDAAEQILNQVGTELAAALDELRAVGRGIFPSMLTDAGLASAVESLVQRSKIPVDVDLPAGRYGPELEAALYFAIAEAVDNANRHSRATRLRVSLAQAAEELRLEISDDGIGMDPSEESTGIAHIRDRIDALGGTLWVASAPGEGVTLAGRVPLGAEVAA